MRLTLYADSGVTSKSVPLNLRAAIQTIGVIGVVWPFKRPELPLDRVIIMTGTENG